VILSKLEMTCQQKESYGKDRKPLLVKVHDFKSFRAENGYSSLEEDDVERVRG
jgi:hypothetical protein